MKRAVILAVFIALLSTLALPGSLPANAESTPTWTSIIAYFNPNPSDGDTPEELGVAVYGDNDSKKPLSLPKDIDMGPFQSGTLLIGKLIGQQGFQGSAVISSSVPVVAVYKQAPSDNAPYSPILYTSFDVSQAGQGKIYIPSIQRSAAYNSQIGVQNIETAAAVLTLHFYNENGEEPFTPDPIPVGANRSYVFKVSDFIGEDFNGSLVIESHLASTELTARLVGAVQEIQGGGRRAYAFEGVSSGSGQLFMPSAGCQAGESKQTTTYAVQNLGADATNVTVDYYYYDQDQNLQSVSSAEQTIQPGYSARFSPCDDEFNEQLTGIGSRMTAIVHSTGENIAAVCRLSAEDGLMTAFLGQPIPDNSSSYTVLLPYVEWSSQADGIHTEILVMNLSEGPANNVHVLYYDRKGKVVADHALGATDGDGPLPAYAVRTSSPSAMRIIGQRGFTGAAVIQSDTPVVALARVTRDVDVDGFTVLGDDYSGIPYINSR